MLNEDSHPESDEYEAPRDVETLAQQGAEPPTGEQPEGAQHRSGDANGQQRCNERSVQHGQRDADRERVNARGKRQQQHDSEPEEVALATILGAVPAASLPKHLSSDRAEQRERDPVVPCLDEGSHPTSNEPPE